MMSSRLIVVVLAVTLCAFQVAAQSLNVASQNSLGERSETIGSALAAPAFSPIQRTSLTLAASSRMAEQAPSFSEPKLPGTSSPEAMWDVLFNYDAGTVTGANGNAGVVYIPTVNEIWTSRWGSGLIHRWTTGGTLIGSFTTSGFTGTRGMTWDGTYVVHSNASGTLYQVDPTTYTTDNTIPLPSGVTARWVTYDPTANGNAGGFWVGNWTTGNLHFYQVSLAGTLLNTINNTTITGIYGGAWDGWTPGGPYLWVFSQGSGQGYAQYIYQISIATGLPTGVSRNAWPDIAPTQATPIAGGLYATNVLVTSKVVLLGTLQGVNDRLFCYELYFNVLKDIKVNSVSLSPSNPRLGTTAVVSAQIANLASEPNPAQVSLTYKRDSAPADSLDGVVEVFTPSWSGNLATVSFAVPYSAASAGTYKMYVRSFYPGDLVPEDDTAKVTFVVTTPLSGTHNVGAAHAIKRLQQVADTLSRSYLTGATTFLLTDASYVDSLVSFGTIDGANSSNTVTIKPALGNTPTVTLSARASFGYGIRMVGTKYVTFDGSNSGGTFRDMMIKMDTTAVNGSVGGVAITMESGCENLTFKNFTLRGFRTPASASTLVTLSGGSASPNKAITFDNLSMNSGFRAITGGGASTTALDEDIVVRNCFIGAQTSDTLETFTQAGIYVTNVLRARIYNNTVRDVRRPSGYGDNHVAGIWVVGNDIEIYGNVVRQIETRPRTPAAAGYFAMGISAYGSSATVTSSRTRIYNNMVFDVLQGYTGRQSWLTGIYGDYGRDGRYQYNSVYLAGTSSDTVNSACFYMLRDTVIVQNNIFFNSRVDGPYAHAVAFWKNSTDLSSVISLSNNNDLFATWSLGGAVGAVTSTYHSTLSAWQTATGQDANSVSADPRFDFTNPLRIRTDVPTIVEGRATPIAGIGTDIYGTARNASTPDMGAHEGNFIASAGYLKDIEVTSLALLAPPYSVGAPITITVGIKNQGTEANPTSVPLTYKAGSLPASSGDGTAETFTPSWTGVTATVTFTVPYTPTASGSLSLYVRAFYPGDENSTNDQASQAVTVYPWGTIMLESFESATFPPSGWVIEDLGSTTTWIRLTEAPRSGSAHARYVYDAATAANDWLISTGYSLSSGGQYRLTYWYRAQDATYPEKMKVAMGAAQNAASMTTVLADHPSITATTYTSNTVAFTVPSTGTYYFGFQCYSDADMFYLNLDDVLLSQVPPIDFSMVSVSQMTGLPTPKTGDLANEEVIFSSKDETHAFVALDDREKGTVASTENHSVVMEGSGTDLLETYSPVNFKMKVGNIGTNASNYSLNWSIGGVTQTTYSGPVVQPGVQDSATLVYNPTVHGTFLGGTRVVASGDVYPDNDSVTFRTRVYPDGIIREIRDRGDNVVNSYVGYGTTTAIKAGLRFTAPANIRLSGVEFIWRSETVTNGTIVVQVRAAGATQNAPGPVLYSRLYTGTQYFSSGGAIINFPFDASAPILASGSDYWITIKPPGGIPFPGGCHNSGFATARSYYESAADTSVWNALVISGTPYQWILRAYGLDATTTVNVDVSSGWTLLSNPVTRPSGTDSVRAVNPANGLFPTSSFNYVFGYASGAGYVQSYRVLNGPGYWGKFPAATVQPVTGASRPSDSIAVVAGWNIVGSISSSIDTVTITSLPTGIKASHWYGYSPTSGYFASRYIEPGKGYWIKANAPGKFSFRTPTVLLGGNIAENDGEIQTTQYNELTIADAEGGSQTLCFGSADPNNPVDLAMFELPPPPPEGCFDARFESPEGGLMLQVHPDALAEAVQFPIAVRTTAYPLKVSWKIVGEGGTYSYALSDAVDGSIFGPQTLSGEGSVFVENPSVSRLALTVSGTEQLPKEFALWQNYPNPFNPVTSIRFALPVNSAVTVEVFNIVGQRVRTLLKEERAAGYHVVQWNGANDGAQPAGSGVYFVRLTAKGENGADFSSVRKIMMLK